MGSNICVVGLLNSYTKNVAKRVSDVLEMFYTDVTEVLEYDLMGIDVAESIVGKEYIEKQETGTIKMLSSYVNTIFTIGFSSLNNENNYGYVKDGCLLIYLRCNQTKFKQLLKNEKLSNTETELAVKQFKDRDKILTDMVDIVADVSKNEDEIKIILSKIEEYYEKR